MSVSPIALGAASLIALAGAVAGNALGSAPMRDYGAYEYVSRAEAGHVSAREDPGPPLPDHYPLVTREGTVEVAALSTRGLYSQARFRMPSHAVPDDPPEFTAEDYVPEESFAEYRAAPARFATGRAAAPEHAAPPSAETQAPLQLAAGPANVDGGAKLIDVQASLAMR